MIVGSGAVGSHESTRDKQLAIQLEINRQLNQELERKQYQISTFQKDSQLMTEALWQEQSKVKLLESDLHDMRLHVHGLD